jgi:hypothetical protein
MTNQYKQRQATASLFSSRWNLFKLGIRALFGWVHPKRNVLLGFGFVVLVELGNGIEVERVTGLLTLFRLVRQIDKMDADLTKN